MELVSIETPVDVKAPTLSVLIGENYENMLKESIERFLDEIRRGVSDFSGFGSIFFRLLQAKVNPPLETIWFYSAVSFRSSKLAENDIFSRILGVKDLFQLLTACSASCNGLKSVAVLGPVLFELYRVVVELFSTTKKLLSAKIEKKMVKEIENLIEGVLSYISICGCEDFDKERVLDDLLPCFPQLIHVWAIDKSNGGLEISESLRVFFPLVSDEIRNGFSGDGVGIDYLVGVVIVEAFLLRLCLKFRSGLSKIVLQKEITTWAVGSITAFRNCCFFEILLKLLLEPTLPITSLLDSENEAVLQKVLYDVVILVNYSFLNFDREIQLNSHCIGRLGITRLIVVHEAIQAARDNGDQTKAISYINAFSRSCIPSKLIKWVTSQIGMDAKASKPNVTTPQALLKWLLNLENQGVRIFHNNTLKLRAKLAFDASKDYEHPVLQPNSKVDDDLFYIDNKREGEEEKADDQEMAESMDAAFTAAVHKMKFTTKDERRKRKEGRKGDENTSVKFLKYHLNESSVKEKFLPAGADEDLTSSESEVENPISDEDMEEIDE